MTDTWNLPIFCINMVTSVTRRSRMQERFKLLGLQGHVKYVDGITPQASIIKHYIDISKEEFKTVYGSEKQGYRDIACLSSHLKAVRSFLETSSNSCLICEDDILFHNEFISKFKEIMDNVPNDIHLVSLGWMVSGAIDKTYTGVNPNKQNLWNIDPQNTWGGQCYYITKEYALQVIAFYDRPLSIMKANSGCERIPPEIFIHKSQGYMVSVPLVIEDCIDSDRAPHDLPFHLKHWCHWNYNDYSNSDIGTVSPLSKLTPKDACANYLCW